MSSALPLLIFGYLGPIIRRKCPEGFVLTEWTRQRYGAVAGLFLSVCTLITIFLYMVSELSAMQQIVTALTECGPHNPVPVILTDFANLGGWSSMALSLMVGQKTAVNAFTGFDAAAHLSEEVKVLAATQTTVGSACPC